MKSAKHQSPSFQLFAIGFFLLLVNTLAIDYLVIKNLITGSTVLGVTTAASTCPQACITLINKSKTATTTKTTGVKEYFIPLGSGIGSGTEATGDWEDVSGVQAYIDPSQYGKIKQITVETTVYVPTGNQKVWIRLVNSTDGRAMEGSELSMTGTGPTVLTSPPITLDGGNKLYKIQMKTQLKYSANITQSRLRITTY